MVPPPAQIPPASLGPDVSAALKLGPERPEVLVKPVRWLRVIAEPTRLEILRLLMETRSATASELTGNGCASGPTVRRHLQALVTMGVVKEDVGESDGETTGRPPARYSLPSEVRAGLSLLMGIGA
jgi:DNA-binding transcriptional ArsR family regulator